MKNLVLVISLLSTTYVVAEEAKYSPNFRETELTEFINIVGKNLKKSIIMDQGVRGKVTVRTYDLLTEEQYYQFFLNVLEVYGYAVIEMPSGVIKVIKNKDAKSAPLPVVEGEDFGGDQFITRVVPVYNVSVRELAPILRQLNDTTGGGALVNYDPSNVILITGRAANVNRLVKIIKRVDTAGDQDIEIVELQHASSGEMVRILESLLKKDGKANTPQYMQPKIVADERANRVIISGDPKARKRIVDLLEVLDQELETNGNTRVFYLKYSKAADLVKVLQGVSKSIQQEAAQPAGGTNRSAQRQASDISIEAHEDSNSLVITAQPDMMRSLEEVIRKIDIRRAQVLVEAIIVEVFEGDGINLGVQWASERGGIQQFGTSGTGITSVAGAAMAARTQKGTQTTVVNPDGTQTTSSTPDELGNYEPLASVLGAVNGFMVGAVKDDWAAILQAVSTDTESNILATPYITTMDNEEADFLVGQEVPVITGQTASANNSNPFQTVNRQDVGIKLKLTPQINEGTAVQLTIEQEVSSVSGATAVDIAINKREIKTTVIADDGQTIVLGGLIDEDIQESVSKIPLLGDIPILGHLFKSTSTNTRKRNLLVFLRPTIIRDGLTMNKISQSKYNFIRAEQLLKRDDGVNLMPNTETPVLPEWDTSLELPPSFDEYLNKKDQEKKNDEKEKSNN